MAQRLANIGDGGSLLIADGVTDLPFPPTSFGVVPDSWGGVRREVGVVPVLDVHFRAVDDVTLTDVNLYSGRRFAVALATPTPDEGDLDATADEVTVTGHDYATGDGPVGAVPDAATIPTGLTEGAEYWLIVVDPNTVQFALSVADALNGVAVDLDDPRTAELDLATLAAGNVDLVVRAKAPGVAGLLVTLDIVFDAATVPTLSEVGDAVTLHVKDNVTTNALLAAVLNTSTKLEVETDTVTPAYVLQVGDDDFAATSLAFGGTYDWSIVPGEAAKRFHWSNLGSLGTIELGAQLAATVSIDHRPGVVAYAAKATFGAAVEVSIQLDPVVDQP